MQSCSSAVRQCGSQASFPWIRDAAHVILRPLTEETSMNRRESLYSSGIGLAFARAGAHAAEFADEKPKRVALVGPGWYGKCDLFRMIQVAPVEVIALCDVNR